MSRRAKNKRGNTPWGFVIAVIITLLIFLILLFFQQNIIGFLKSLFSDNACKTSVYLHSLTKIAGKDFIENAKLDCPTNYMTISKEKEVLPKVAYELYRCWNNFGSGKLELFKPESGVYCAVCSVIEFKGMEGYIPGLLKYLANNKPPKHEETYLELLNGVRFTESTFSAYNNYVSSYDKQSIRADKPLAIVFLYSKEAKTSNIQTAMYGTGAGAVALGALSFATWGWAGLNLLLISVSPIIVVPTVVAGGIVAGAIAGGGIGYLLGSDSSADWDAKVLAAPYEGDSLKNIGCKDLPVSVK